MFELFRQLDSTVSILCLGPAPDEITAEGWLRDVHSIAFAATSADGATGEPNSRVVSRMLTALSPGDGFDFVHADSVAIEPQDDVASVWSIDYAHLQSADDIALTFDLCIADLESERLSAAQQGRRAIRLPRSVSGEVSGADTRAYLGWWTEWTKDKAEYFTEVLNILARQNLAAKHNFLIGGPGAERVEIPPLLDNRAVANSELEYGIALRTLSLGLCPGLADKNDLATAVNLLNQGSATILSEHDTHNFEGRWAIPSVDSPEDSARFIDGWPTSSEDRDEDRYALTGTQRTRAAFCDDTDAMKRHVSTELDSLRRGF